MAKMTKEQQDAVVDLVAQCVGKLLKSVSARLDQFEQIGTVLGLPEDTTRTLSVQMGMELTAQLAKKSLSAADEAGIRDFGPKLLDGLKKVFAGRLDISYTVVKE